MSPTRVFRLSSRNAVVPLFLLRRLLLVFFSCILSFGSSGLASPIVRPPLRFLNQVRRVKPDAAGTEVEIHVRAVVTYYDSVGPNLFVQDVTGGIWVDLRGASGITLPQVGQLLDLHGVVGQGFTPYVAKPQWKILGSSPLPRASPVTYEQAASGSFDSQRVEMEGIVRSFLQQAEGNVLVIDVATPTGKFKVRVPNYHAAFPLQFVDAKVRFRGVCGTSFNRRNQLVAIHLLMPDLKFADVTDAAPVNPFDVSTTPIGAVRRFSADLFDVRRIKVIGIVTARYPAQGLFLTDATGGLYAESQDGTTLVPGQEVEVIGFPTAAAFTPILKSASIRPTGKHETVSPLGVDGHSAAKGGFDAQLVTILGTVQAATQQKGSYTLALQSEDHVAFEARFATRIRTNSTPPIGSKLRLTGICSVKTDENGNPSAFEIVLRDPGDVVVLSSPSWMTARRAVSTLSVLAVLTLTVIGWVLILRKRVLHQTNLIKLRFQKEIALEERYRQMFERNLTGLYVAKPDGDLVDCNDACARMLGYANRKELLGSSHEARAITAQFHEQLSGGTTEIVSAEHNFRRRDGSMGWSLTNVRLIHQADSAEALFEGALVDITDRKVAEEQVQYLAFFDSLTGLPNRRLLMDRLDKALAGARRRKEKVAVLFLDLDRFKTINDSLGHSVGDLFVREVAERLKGCAREQDTVARVGGDEFLIVLTSVKDVADAAVAAERIMDAMSAEFSVQGHSLGISCSLGISVFPEHGEDSEALIKNADAAMYCAKESGRDNFRFFTADMNDQVVERLTLENSLRLAIGREELFLMYQPQMDIATGRITGLEALLRWQHPELGLVPPDRFIRIAENCGLIIPIGEWVLRTACSQARKWQDEGLPAVPVAVNVSAVQFRQDDFCKLLTKVLRETGLAPQYLELELTESLLLSNADVTLSVLQELKAMGLKLAIDDFGTGYSSLSYLKRFPVSKLKIDGSFIRDVAVNADDAAIATAIISMAKSLNLKVIAEGVENEAQMSFLRAHLCDEIQGYYFSKPLTVDAVVDRLRGPKSQRALSASSGVLG
jgi:diguanylate cyclase (GGDEF)-like protein/PAS domain S-box-containing protein